ncbi:MAG: hypothetical protein K9J76_05325 [Polaromonas sp.]|nr:hypothetical protein [Polaromonas sp.]
MTDFRFGRNVKPNDRAAVCWYHPAVLLLAARDVLSSLNQFRNRDERESFPLPMTVIDRSQRQPAAVAVGDEGSEAGDFWFDFIADTGDGGNATYAVARTALADQVVGDAGQVLPRGELLVLGGDLAYPSASSLDYRYRFTELFEAALPDEASYSEAGKALVRGRPFTLAALPQNHDWMDSASTFGRYFLRSKNSRTLLAAEIPQRQSYFCVRLPGGWWLLGLDFAMHDDIDRDQFEQFKNLASAQGLQTEVNGQPVTQRMLPDDRVILLYPEPVWTTPVAGGVYPGGAKRHQLLEGLLQSRIALRLAGDLHHYMRWTSEKDGQLITCGTGGAFTHPTHTRLTTAPIVARNVTNASAIPASAARIVQVGLDDGRTPAQSRPFSKVTGSEYPPIKQSRQLARGNVPALFGSGGGGFWQGNRWFAALLAGLYLVSAGLQLLPFGLLWSALLFAALCLPLGWESRREVSPKWPAWSGTVLALGSGLAHVLCHVAAVSGVRFGLAALPTLTAPLGQAGSALLWPVGLLAGGAVLGTLIFGSYLALMSRLGFLTTNGFSALALPDFKGFLRFCISADGALHGYFVAIDQVPRVWSMNENPQPVWLPTDRSLRSRVHDQFVIRK